MIKIRNLLMAFLVVASFLIPSSAYIKPVYAATSTAQETMYAQKKCYTYDTPFKGHIKVATLYAGDKVTVVSETKYYYELKDGTYAAKKYLNTKRTTWTTFEYKAPKTLYANRSANLLNKALSDSKNVGTVSTGDALTVIGYTNTGYYRLSNNKYIKKSYVSKNVEMPNPASDFKYKEIEGGIKITKYIGTDMTVVIPDKIDGLPVIAIGQSGVNNVSHGVFIASYTWVSKDGSRSKTRVDGDALITSIVLPDTLKIIDDYAFVNCVKLKSIVIPNSVIEIGRNAFENCTKLTSVEIPDSVTRICWNAFENCKSLTSINIPNSVTFIGSFAFNGCTELSSITLPNKLTDIHNGVFKGCSKIKEIDIPESVTSIDINAFIGTNITSITIPAGVTEISGIVGHCASLAEINVSKNNKHYKSIDGVLFTKDGKSIEGYPSAKDSESYIIPDSVTEITMFAFCNCTKLKYVTLPNRLYTIHEDAFDSDCIESVTHYGRTYTSDEFDLLYNVHYYWGT
ncbi:MAG: leucine-rich repeat protein [Oscillospiraceae bacterium]